MYKELLYSNSLCFWDGLLSQRRTTCVLPSPYSPSHLPTIPAFSVAPENVFILSLNEDVSKQLGNKWKDQRVLCWLGNWLEIAHQTTLLKETQTELQTSGQNVWLWVLNIIQVMHPSEKIFKAPTRFSFETLPLPSKDCQVPSKFRFWSVFQRNKCDKEKKGTCTTISIYHMAPGTSNFKFQGFIFFKQISEHLVLT